MKILAIDIGGTSIKTGLCDEHGHFEMMKEYETLVRNGEGNVVEKLLKIISEFHNIDAIGISTAGQVNSEQGYIYASENIPDLTGKRLKEIVEKKFHVPVKLENDVNAAALGEKYFGAGRDLSDFLCLTYGTGVGGAIVLESKLYKGHKGIAAEFGHMITHPLGHKCGCGRLGCYETYASTTALVNRAKEINKDYLNGKNIFAPANQDDPILEKAIQDWIFEVALGLTSLIHIFDPPTIIIGGGVMEQEKLVNRVSMKVKELILESYSDVSIIKASLGNKAGIYGAASLHLKSRN
ncbi:ROK family protein [Bacillus sp. DTU_2020_1000418_1_SI_GHA_SEK_038]|uniref:ROK family protein n=1 Tax=Bacillus sp. DTU_2020_1000418_1_SI_GHA_SEK_038 TaxID=3077585 RepID=UPI0028EF04E9|nr:ROK family protein [Bacillus sp. DTU_2020_1000418_1_SI_GHA_SEK_038]WNS76580.1 ROK family protein [Bacillus sp. DTU_2020_1000418_1_SI_GHA_SEK_038]